MDQQDKYFFTSIKAQYDLENQTLDLLPDVQLKSEVDGINYKIKITQNTGRIILVQTDQPVYWAKFTDSLYCLERLLMIFDGIFIPLKRIEFAGQQIEDVGVKNECERQVEQRRLSYFNTSSLFTIADKLMDYSEGIDEGLFEKWKDLLNELGIVNQMYLYTISDSHMPVDFRLAFLIELAESMVDIVNVEKGLFPSLDPGSRGTWLKQCLNALINTFGTIIFSREIKDGYDSFLSLLVDSRVRIMHIKRKQSQEKYFDGNDSIRYMLKMSLLYRVILLNLLNVDKNLDGTVRKISESIDQWIDSRKISTH